MAALMVDEVRLDAAAIVVTLQDIHRMIQLILEHRLGSSSVSTFAKRHEICERTVYHEIAAGRLIARKVGRRTIIAAEDEQRWRDGLPKLQVTDNA